MTDTTTGDLQGWRCNFCGALVPYGKSHAHTGINEAAPRDWPDWSDNVARYGISELAQEERDESETARLRERIEELEQLLDFLQMAIHSAAGNMTAADERIRKYREGRGA